MKQTEMKRIRQDRDLTQKQVCKIMKRDFPEFDEPLLSKMENGHCNPTTIQAEKLAEIYDCFPFQLKI